MVQKSRDFSATVFAESPHRIQQVEGPTAEGFDKAETPGPRWIFGANVRSTVYVRANLAVRCPGTLEKRFDATVKFDYQPRYNIAPRQDLATIRNTTPETIGTQNWGLLAPWADGPDDGRRPINARAETLAEKPMFEEPLAERRCLVLADGFYEWQGERGSKQPYRVHLADDAPFAMAGLWNRFEHDGGALETVTIVTSKANDVVAPIHDRMPVILERAD